MVPENNLLIDSLVLVGSMVALWCGALATAYLTDKIRQHSVRRQNEMTLARVAVRRHFDASERFSADPDSPEILVSVLNDVAEIVSKRDRAYQLADFMLKRARNLNISTSEAIARKNVLEALARLEKFRPDLCDLYKEAIGSGIDAMVLRWPRVATVLTWCNSVGRSNRSSREGLLEVVASRLRETQRISVSQGKGSHMSQTSCLNS
jgi:hypothetical protein